MLRIGFLASVVPLVVAGVFAGGQLLADVHPCISTAEASVQIAQMPWQVQRRVSFTSDPGSATVRVQIVDDPASADFAIVDGAETREASGCDAAGPIRFIGISEPSSATPTVIYLSRDGAADYRIFVNSKSFTPREAAALIVGAQAERRQLASKSL